MAITFNKKMLIERVKRHIADGWPTNSFSASDKEILLYIDSAIAQAIIGHAYVNAKIEGALCTPEAYLITYALTLPVFNENLGEYSTTLPQPPISLPLGYSITTVFFGGKKGRSQAAWPIKAKRVSYRADMPVPNGVRYWVEGSVLKLAPSNGQPLNPGINTLYVTMPATRTADVNETMTIPDDDISGIFDYTVKQLIQRMNVPKDIIQDNLPAGNKSS